MRALTKTRQNGLGEIDILSKRQAAVVTTFDRIGRCNDRSTCLQCSHDTCLGNADALLFHRFVNARSAVLLVSRC